MGLGVTELLVLLLILLLLFGATRLPKLAKSLREARQELEGDTDASARPSGDDAA